MTQFKVGDKVRRTGYSNHGVVVGDEYTVASVDDCNWLRLSEVPDNDGFHGFSGQNFELVLDSDAKYDTLVQDLVKHSRHGDLYKFVDTLTEPKKYDVTLRLTESEKNVVLKEWDSALVTLQVTS